MVVTLENKRGHIDLGLLTAPQDKLVLRALGPNYHGDLLRLSPAKCTIGSSPNCTLRLLTPGIAPLHCMILRGPHGAVVKRWDDNTQLNGREFTEATLRTGDRLRCGPVEFEIVAGLKPLVGILPCGDTRRVSLTLTSNQHVPQIMPSPPPTANVERLKTARDLMRSRMRRLLSQWRSSRWELARFQSDARRHEETGKVLEQRVVELEQLISDYRDQLANSERRTATVDADRLELLSKVESLTTYSDNLQQDFASRTAEWDLERDNLHSRLAAAQHGVDEAKELREKLQAADDASTQTQQQCAELSAQLQQLHEQHREALCKLEDAEQMRAYLQAVPTTVESATDALTAEQTTPPLNADDMADLATSTSEEVTHWRAQAEAAEAAAETSRQSMLALQTQIETLREQCATSTQRAEELENVRQQLELRLAEVPASAGAATEFEEKFVAVEGLLTELRSQNDELSQQLAKLLQENANVTEQLRVAEAARNQMESLVNELGSQLANGSPNLMNGSDQRAEQLQSRMEELEVSTHESDDTRRRLALANRLGCDQNLCDLEAPLQAELPQSDAISPISEEEVFQSPLLASLLRTNSDNLPTEANFGDAGFADQGPSDDGLEPVDLHMPIDPAMGPLTWNNANRPDDLIDPAHGLPDLSGHPAYMPDTYQDPSSLTSEELLASQLGFDHNVIRQDSDIEGATPPQEFPEMVAPQENVIPDRGSTHTHTEEESIEDYMSRLLKRVRGDNQPKAPYEMPREATTAAPSNVATPNVPAESEKTDASEAAKKPQYVQRTSSPELRENMSAMREIANSTARTAIETHQKRGWKESSQAKLLGAVCATMASTATLYFACRNPSLQGAVWQFAGAAAGLVVAVYWTMQGSHLSHRSRTPQVEEKE